MDKGTSPDGACDSIFLVHAAVVKVSGQANALDADLLGKLFRRRLSRLERVLASHGGRVVRNFPQGLLAAFDTAEVAVLVACEMQRRCAVIPQIMDTQIGLKIGIHPVAPGHKQATEETTAAWLTTLRGEGTIVASEAVVEALPATLHEKTSPLDSNDKGISIHLIDWNAIPMRPLPVQEPQKPTPPRSASLILRQGRRVFRFGADKTVVTIGRALDSDVVIQSAKASRQHCRIVYRLDNHVLVDMSMNGTYVQSGNAPEKAIRKNMMTLSGSGRIAFGHSCEVDGEHVFEFEIG
ncbi:MAG: FHA domain-containing protein [Dechloromonas sp.]|nr:FHA domain-containing protein [Dechloromonas sp.]